MDAGQFDIATTLTTNSTFATYGMAFAKSYANKPGLAYGIIKYSCTLLIIFIGVDGIT